MEKLGIYNPNTNPATIELNVDNSVQWLQNGAQPSDTARAILSYKGAMLKHHLWGGVRKGALTEEQVEEKFNAWLEEKEKSVGAKIEGLDKEKAAARKKALAAEKEVSDKRALAAVEAELPETAEGESAPAEAPKPKAEEETVEAVVETPETPQPDRDNADHTPIPTVVDKEILEETEGIAEAPSVEEVMEESDEEVKPSPSAEEE